MLIEIPSFKGMAPRISARDLLPEYAQTSVNTDLKQGILKPFYGDGSKITLNTTAWKSIFPVKSGTSTFWCCSTSEANFINSSVYDAAGRFLYSDGTRSKISNYTLASNAGANSYGVPNTSYHLGVPPPSAALTATVKTNELTLPSPSDLDIHWPLNDGDGTTATDASGNSNDGTINGTVSWVEQAQDFGGVNTYNTISTYSVSGDVSYCAWFKPDTYANNGSVVGNFHLATLTEFYGFNVIIQNATTIKIHAGIGPGSGYQIKSWKVPDMTYDWHHIIVVHDSGVFKVYLDGVDLGSHWTQSVTHSGSSVFGCGRWALNYDGYYFDGLEKDIRLYTAALTAAEVRAIYEDTKGEDSNTGVDSVSYVYTYITSWGEEGSPSDPTDVYDIVDNQYVELGNFQTTVPSGHGIVGYRIYRTSTGSVETNYQLVTEILTGSSPDYITPAEVAANGDIWNDRDSTTLELTLAEDLGETIVTDNYDIPPNDLKGLLPMPNGVSAGFRDREIYLSEPFLNYAYPADYIFTTRYDIKAIASYGTTIVIGTEGYPYKLNGYDPQAASLEVQVDKQSCLFSRAMVSGDNFVLYPSPDGLYMIGDNRKGNVANNLFTKEQWRSLLTASADYDKTIIAFLYDNKYYAFFEGTNDGFIIDFDSQIPSYVTFSLNSTYSVYGGYVDLEDDTLYLLVKIGSTYYIKSWEGSSSTYLSYTWKSKVNVTPYTFFSCMKVNGDFSDDSNGTGTISTSGTAVTGTGTHFDTQLKAGYVIYDSNSKTYREIDSVTDATHCVLVTAFASNLTATTFKYNSSMVNLYRDDSLIFTRALNQTSPFRIPSGRGREWEIEFKGNKEIYSNPILAQSMEELIHG